MSATAEHPTATAEHHGDGHHGHHEPFLAHHFESWKQQFDAGKLGMWAFLIQEILFFSGLFCAYATYRSLHPEVFEYADQFLSVPHGAVNTVVLLFSSLTMAWGVRCAMLGRNTGLIVCLSITLFCAALFLGVKAYEYTEKYHAGLVWAGADPLAGQRGSLAKSEKLVELNPKSIVHGEALEKAFTATLHKIELIMAVVALLAGAGAAGVYYGARERIGLGVVLGCISLSAVAIIIGAAASLGIHHWAHGAHTADSAEEAEHMAAAEHEGESGQPEGSEAMTGHEADIGAHNESSVKATLSRPDRIGIFFSIYFVMTGIHAIHIIGGMVVITWLMTRAFKGHFTPNYFGPVDFVGLYWHLVDLIWIYLFPLLYLIG
jgi:cytochrome c oxidase subunit 3